MRDRHLALIQEAPTPDPAIAAIRRHIMRMRAEVAAWAPRPMPADWGKHTSVLPLKARRG